MVFTIKESIGTLPTSGTPTVSTTWIQHDVDNVDAKIELLTDVIGVVTVEYGYDASTVDRSDTYDITVNNWHKIIKLKARYVRVKFTLDGGAPDATYFRLDYLHSDTVEQDNNTELTFADDSVSIYGQLGGEYNPVAVANDGNVHVRVTNAISTSEANLDIPLSTVNTSLAPLSNLDVALSTLETTLSNIETNTAGSADTSNLDIPQSEIKAAIIDVNSNLQITNTLLDDLANLDVPLSSATSTLNTSITGVNSNVVTLSDKFRTGAEQALDPADPSNVLVQTLIYGFHEGHGSGTDDQHPISVNENGHLFATVQTNGTPLDVINANVDIPLSSGVNTLNNALTGINSNINNQSSLLVNVSNINVPLSDIATLIDNSNVTNITGLGAVATAVNNVDTRLSQVDSNLAIYNARQTSVFSNSVTQIGQILVPSPISNGRLLSVNVASASANQVVVGLYPQGATAPLPGDTPFHVIYLDNTVTTLTQNFGPGGIAFSNGIGIRAQTVSGKFDIFSNSAVAADAVACSITYTTE
jgi:hypothetical protein